MYKTCNNKAAKNLQLRCCNEGVHALQSLEGKSRMDWPTEIV